VTVGVYVDCGSKYEAPGYQGASHLLERMAFKGTANRSHLRITREAEAIGAHLQVSGAREQMSYTADVLKGHFPEAVELLADVVVNPKFKAHELVTEVRRRSLCLSLSACMLSCPHAAVSIHTHPCSGSEAHRGRFCVGAAGVVKTLLCRQRPCFSLSARRFHTLALVRMSGGRSALQMPLSALSAERRLTRAGETMDG